MGALTTLTAASVAAGVALRQLPAALLAPGGLPVVDLAAAGAFAYFGVQMLGEASAAAAAATECGGEVRAHTASQRGAPSLALCCTRPHPTAPSPLHPRPLYLRLARCYEPPPPRRRATAPTAASPSGGG